MSDAIPEAPPAAGPGSVFKERRGWVRRVWDFIDERDIDKHVVAVIMLTFFIVGTVKIVDWGIDYADTWLDAERNAHPIAGSEVALVVAAVLAPWTVMVSTVVPFLLSFYFKRQQP